MPEYRNLVMTDAHKCTTCAQPVHVPCCAVDKDDKAVCWTCLPTPNGGGKPAAKRAAVDEAVPLMRVVKPKGEVTKDSAKVSAKRGTTVKVAAAKEGRGKAVAKGVMVGTAEGDICVYKTCKAIAGTELFLCARGSECSKKMTYKGGASFMRGALGIS
jgi:hypothetical protein